MDTGQATAIEQNKQLNGLLLPSLTVACFYLLLRCGMKRSVLAKN